MNFRRVGLLSLVILSGVAIFLAADWYRCLPPGLQPTFVGQATCASCHPGQSQNWKGSHHAEAMALATSQNVLGNFENATFEQFGVKSRMFHEGDKYFVETEGRTAAKLETFTVKYTFGVSPLQQYLVEFPDGRLQVLPLCWNVNKQEWFHIYPNEPIRPGDPLHWTGFAQTWNHMCAECHSTDVHKNFSPLDNTYHTTFSEINVSCEACHGPGSTHVQIAKSKKIFWDRNYGTGLPSLKNKDPKTQLDTCAHCHANHSVLHEGFQPGKAHDDFFNLGILDELRYHADGQILEEVFETGSFEQSLMFRKGVVCTDCHDPHTSKLRAEGNALCTRCHLAAKFDTTAHTHHLENSAGSKCVACHMPTKTYMVVHERRDHSIRIPRPDLSDKLETPNACNQCHRHSDKSANWAAGYVTQWFGEKRRDNPHYGEVLSAGRAVRPSAEKQLIPLTKSKDVGPIVRATAVALLGQYASPESQAAVAKAIEDSDPTVRAAAISSLAGKDFKEVALKLLDDPVRVVRAEAFQRLLPLDENLFSAEETQRLKKAFDEYAEGVSATLDVPRTELSLGEICERFHDDVRAEAHYRMTIKLDPTDVGSRQHLAMLLARQKKHDEAGKIAREAVDFAKQNLEQQNGLIQILTSLGKQDLLKKAKSDLNLHHERIGNSLLVLSQVLLSNTTQTDEVAKLVNEAAEHAQAAHNAALLYDCGELLMNPPLLKYREAATVLRQAVELRPEDTELRAILQAVEKQIPAKP